MVLPQLVDAACIDGPSKKLIHLIFRVQGFLSTAARGRWNNGHCEVLPCRCRSMSEEVVTGRMTQSYRGIIDELDHRKPMLLSEVRHGRQTKSDPHNKNWEQNTHLSLLDASSMP